jgi:hypothetical protein
MGDANGVAEMVDGKMYSFVWKRSKTLFNDKETEVRLQSLAKFAEVKVISNLS